jgi:hypothetical protein
MVAVNAAVEPFDEAYKEWMHVDVLDHASGCIAVVNASSHGGASARQTFAGAVLLHVPGRGWIGGLETSDAPAGQAGLSTISAGGVAVAYERSHGRLLASASLRTPPVELQIEAAATAKPFDVWERIPFGSGWISWSVMPRLSMTGTLTVQDIALDLRSATCYHDRNWGRWRWSTDARWDWGVLAAADGGPLIVFTRDTTRHGDILAGPIVLIDTIAGRRIFGDASVTMRFAGELPPPRLRLPGALAALHQDRRRPPLPARVELRCEDGFDVVEVEIDLESACQLITSEVSGTGYGFIHEIAGTFAMTARLRGERLEAAGLAVFEYTW